jgi:hypothetical protein
MFQIRLRLRLSTRHNKPASIIFQFDSILAKLIITTNGIFRRLFFFLSSNFEYRVLPVI